MGLAIVAFEFAYYSPGASDTGSLYHHELVLPGSLLAAEVFDVALERWPDFAKTALALHFGFGTLVFVTEQTLRLGRLVTTIHADADAALSRIDSPCPALSRDPRQRATQRGLGLRQLPRALPGHARSDRHLIPEPAAGAPRKGERRVSWSPLLLLPPRPRNRARRAPALATQRSALMDRFRSCPTTRVHFGSSPRRTS